MKIKISALQHNIKSFIRPFLHSLLIFWVPSKLNHLPFPQHTLWRTVLSACGVFSPSPWVTPNHTSRLNHLIWLTVLSSLLDYNNLQTRIVFLITQDLVNQLDECIFINSISMSHHKCASPGLVAGWHKWIRTKFAQT